MEAREKYKHKCQRCGLEWESYKKEPRACPRCKSYYWREKRKEEEKENG